MKQIHLFNKLQLPIIIILIAILAGCQNNSNTGLNRSDSKTTANTGIPPKEALSTFQLEPGFKIELLVAEPLISDPVDMEIDEFGRLYVVEMHGYPLDKSGTGIIKLVSDTNGDGQMDKSIVFAEGLTLPTSIMRWKKGVLVTDAPNVLYYEDTDGDSKSDIRDTLLTGFALSNPQHNLNSPVYGIDNWIYLGHQGAVGTQTYLKEFGDPGTEIYFPDHPAGPRLPENASGRSVRFRLDQHLIETTSSNTQFGHTFDVWGRHILVSNANHIYQEVIAAQYLQRNPKLLIPDAAQSLSDHSDAAEVFPITKNPEHQLLTDIGVITSACGITIYTGGAFPSPFDNASFVAEPVSNLVHVDKLADKGSSFAATRIHPTKEFLASTDAWFRPVNMYTGPDGALYVIDYYRQIIEHPEWMDEEAVKSGKLYNGHDKGRIYRITTANTIAADWTKGLNLGNVSSDRLVDLLSNSNAWWRINAQRLLVDRKDTSVVPALVKMTRNSSPLGRLHGLWSLEGLQQLKPDLIEHALKDPVAGIRENAIKLAELHLATNPDLSKALLLLQDDPDPKVRFQLLCTLGSVTTQEALKVRNKLLFRDINDQWVQVAALSATSSQNFPLLNVVLDSFRKEVPAYSSLVHRLSTMIAGYEKTNRIEELIQRAIKSQNAEWKAPMLDGLADGLKNQKTVSGFKSTRDILIKLFFEDPSRDMRNACLHLLETIGINGISKKESLKKAALIAEDERQPEVKRVEAIRFLALDNPAPYTALLEKLISPREQSSIQVAAIQTLSRIPGTIVSQYILKQWNNLTPGIQDEAMNTFLRDTKRTEMLLDAIESGRVLPSSVGWYRSVHLMAQEDLRLRSKARALLTKSDQEMVKVIKDYQKVFTLEGDEKKGKNIFLQSCSNCHQIRGSMGDNFGPDLGTIHNWSSEAIMANILSPDLSISSGYDLCEVQLNNGETLRGVISSETATTITLKNEGRRVRTINRNDIQSLKALNMSLMPAGLEKQINQQQMADLLAYLRQNK